ncbi:MAG TPA: GSCFA domain-containing protein [Hanamia sp.]|nr:GSCFA domain-containing protein [Hanamia sp.]
MEFFLPIQIPSFPFTISYTDKILFLGSCFSEEIGNKLYDLKFDILQNPNGILYDPQSIADAVFDYVNNKKYSEQELFELNGLWHSWKHHSQFSGVNKNDVLEKINQSQSRAHIFLKEAKILIITLGAAYNYILKDKRQNVANCHKAPSSFFEKNLLSTKEIIRHLIATCDTLHQFNGQLKIIFTISPVKHVKDGIVENNRSKARLIEAVHSIVEEKESAFYFPSYELVTDVLRDYRFYKDDLVHPNETATSYVFHEFCNSLLTNQSKKIMEEITKILSAVNHKPFFKESEAYQRFIDLQLQNIENLESKYPFIDLSNEKKYFIGNKK